MIQRLLILVCVLAMLPEPTAAAPAAPPAQPDAMQLARALDKLLVTGSVLYVAAHPDDENTRLLAWLANDRLLRTGYLSITRGDGGQNLIGSEQGPLLGLIRTQELLAARRIDGAEQFFTRARDFGYSKRADEALAIWGRDDTLSDVVLAIRRFKPDVIITRFPPDNHETHGHHTASAQLAIEAYDKAADPHYEPQQVQRFGVWHARRLLWNDSLFPGAPPHDMSGFVKIDVGAYSPERGLSWGELAAESRSMHKSQGFGAARQRGPAIEYFKLLAGEPIAGSPLDGVVTDWSRIPGSAPVVEALQNARASFVPATPERAIPQLLAARDALDRIPEHAFSARKRADIDAAILACAGVFTDVTAAAASVAQGGTIAVTAQAIARRKVALTWKRANIGGKELFAGKALSENAAVEISTQLQVAQDAPLSNPYWLELPIEPGRYPVRDANLIGLPEANSALEAELEFILDGHAIHVTRALAYRWTDPVAGERYRALEVLPKVTLDPVASVLVFPDAHKKELRVRVRSLGGAKGSVALEVPRGFGVAPQNARFELAAGGEVELAFQLTPPASAASGSLRAVARVDGDSREYDRGLMRIEHGHIPIQTLLPRAEVRVVRTDVVRKREKVGYLPGAGDAIPAALAELGYRVVTLDPKALTEAALASLEVIVTGVRAWNVEPRLLNAHALLMAWVARGGTLVAQYNTNNRIGPAPPELGPYPFSISQLRTTDENAGVELARDPILSQPNAISAQDFAGWVQERGLYFADSWDAHYRAPLSMSDPGEKPLRGALLVAKHGKGAFIYTGLALFRQLPAGVPGAYRLFANLIEYDATR